MNFKNNFSNFYLLTNKPIKFWDDENHYFELKLPTLEDFYTDYNLTFCIDLLEKDIDDLKKIINIEVKNEYEFFHTILTLSSKLDNLKDFSDSFIKGFQIMIPEFNFNKTMKIKDFYVNSELFYVLIDIIMQSMDKKVIKITDEDDEFTRMEKKAKIKAEKIRKNSKKDGKGTSIEDMIASILYEFPQYKIEDLIKMNLYIIYFLFKQVGKIVNYEVNQIAMGNGLLKSNKFKYFIDK